MRTGTRRVVIVGYDDVTLLDVACPADVLDAANRYGAEPTYDVVLASLDGGPMRAANGLTLTARERLADISGPLDTLLVAGGIGYDVVGANPAMIEQLRRLAAVSRRIASVCVGSGLLASAGLLDGRRATTHWRYVDEQTRRHPTVRFDPAPIYIRDGDVWTAAGVTSGLDLAMAFVEADHGPELARSVARSLVTYLQRPANQAQVSMFVSGPVPEHAAVRTLTGHIANNPGADLSAPALARRVGLSERQLTRLFAQQLGVSPARHVRATRVSAAAQLLTTTGLPLSAVARRCGFGSTETLRQAFHREYRTSPSTYRSLYRQGAVG